MLTPGDKYFVSYSKTRVEYLFSFNSLFPLVFIYYDKGLELDVLD